MAIAAALTLAAGCASQPDVRDIEVSDAVATEPIMGERGALYFAIENRGPDADALLAISTAAAAAAEIHRTVSEGGMGRMEPVDSLPLAAGGTLSLAPGGYHVMLLQLRRQFSAGDTLTATLRFQHHEEITIRAPVVAHADLEAALGASHVHD